MTKVNLKLLQPYLDKGLIKKQSHPTCNYQILNYSHKCQYNGVWDEITMACRGLILDNKGNVIARPLRKFFNYGEHTGKDSKLVPIPKKEPSNAYEKLDGSLGILYFEPDGKVRLATRGSFTSDQAIVGTKLLKKAIKTGKVKIKDIKEIDKYATMLFEIIYPQNRIVVDYGDQSKLVWIGLVDKETGLFMPTKKNKMFEVPEMVTDFEKPDNREGYVVIFKNHLMVKVKFDEYVRLHRLITGVNKKSIWDILRHGQEKEFSNLIKRVPDEFYNWVKNTRKELEFQFKHIESESSESYTKIIKRYSIGEKITRKEFALKANKTKYPSILFKMWDGQPYKKLIWQLIKPKAEKPYKEEV